MHKKTILITGSAGFIGFHLSKKILSLGLKVVGVDNFIDKPKSQSLKSFKEKLIKTFIHGFLHLLNFDHIKDKDYIKMLKEEELIYKSEISKFN